MESKLINYQKVLTEGKTKLDKILASYKDTNEGVKKAAGKIDALYAGDLSERKPRIMVYGIYNAGKSSIINELLRDDKAKVADVPTTDKVTTYEWNGYMISDTPGVAAPIEHEEVTMEALKENDVVIFVMSTSGSYEKAENYERIKNIIQAGKKVILVLNDKEGYLFGEDKQELKALDEIKHKVFNNMRTVGIDSAEKCILVVVDADLAKNGRLSNNAEDIKQSNFGELERAVLSELKNTSSYRLLRNDVQQIIENVKIATEEIAQLEGGNDIYKKLNEVLANINDYRTGLRNTMQNYINGQQAKFSRDLFDAIWVNRENQEKLNAEVAAIYDKIVERVSRKLSQEFADLQVTIAPDLQSLIEELKKIKVRFKPDMPENDSPLSESAAHSTFDLNLDKIQDLIKGMEDLWELINKKTLVDPNIILQLVQKDLLTNMMGIATKGAFTTASGKAVADLAMKNSIGKLLASGLAKVGAGAVVPYIGPIVGIVLTLYDLFKDDEAAKVAEANERRRIMAEAEAKAKFELQQKCQFVAEDLEDELSLTIGDIIINTCNGFQAKLEEQSKIVRSTQNSIANDVRELRDINNEYQNLALQLGGQN